jgi:chromosome partitioning protein
MIGIGVFMIIGMLNQKGGVGKTTLSISIAHSLALKNKRDRILVVDADPQQSALSWSDVREGEHPFTVISLPKKSLHKDISKMQNDYDHIIIDGPPRVTDLARACIMASDLVIIPCTPSPYDIWASEETVNLVKEATQYKENLKFLFTLNRKIVNTAISRDVIKSLKEMDMKVSKAQISQRVLFAETAAQGCTVFDVDPNGKAASEINNLVKELKRLYCE